jgi:hypothetical protein
MPANHGMNPGRVKWMLVPVGVALVLGAVGTAVFRLVVPRPPPADVPVLMYHRIADDA